MSLQVYGIPALLGKEGAMGLSQVSRGCLHSSRAVIDSVCRRRVDTQQNELEQGKGTVCPGDEILLAFRIESRFGVSTHSFLFGAQ